LGFKVGLQVESFPNPITSEGAEESGANRTSAGALDRVRRRRRVVEDDDTVATGVPPDPTGRIKRGIVVNTLYRAGWPGRKTWSEQRLGARHG
jgi:hypothetical protein